MMKNRRWLLLMFVVLSNPAFSGQDVYELFIRQNEKGVTVPKTVPKADKRVVELRKYNPAVKKINTKSVVKLSIDDKVLSFNVKSINRKTDSRWSFSGFTHNVHDFLHIAESNGNVVGSLLHSGVLYKIRPDKDGGSIISKVEQDTLIDHDESYYLNYNLDSVDTTSLVSNDSTQFDSNSEFTVIVAYTAGFLNDAGTIDAYMDLLEQETNTSYANSEVDTRVRIVHAYQTSYSQSGDFYADLDYFSNASNPETQELLDLRDTFNADVMMVLAGNNDYSYCGIAREIGASAGNALALAKESCAVGYYSFGHELGHLFGARHIIDNDSSIEPFEYGHGYCNTTSDTWRTVMAYGCPPGTGGVRIQQWSNPNITINDEPTGTAELEFNARVINERAQVVANFRQSSSNENEDLSWLIPVINLILL
jgi:hypothetical protein